jgi:predicted AlkP superfamily pyrophosphatase or phosphodiesterase
MLPALLVISFDAFMFQYFNVSTLHLPNFDYLQRRGILAPLEPQFTSKTFPNHWSMITGLYEDASNIVDNYMYDPKLGYFSFQEANATTFAKWLTYRYSGEPIWVSNERQSLRNSGVYMWPGSLASDAEPSIRCRQMIHYNDSEARDYHKSVDTVVDWMSTKDVNFGMIYFPEPDGYSHRYGPFSLEVYKALQEIDDALGYLIRKLKVASDLWSRINIMILSDHGMTVVNNVIDISFIQNDTVAMTDNAAVLQIQPKEGKAESIITSLKAITPIKVYRKEELPERYHYLNSERILPIVAVADEGYAFALNDGPYPIKGQHGYDPQLPSMHGIFLASGPKFKSGVIRKKSIMPIDAHAIMAHVLGVTTPPNNGSLSRVEDMLNLDFFDLLAREEHSFGSSDQSSSSYSSSIAIVVVAVVFAAVIAVIFVIRTLCNRRYTIVTIRGERHSLMPLQAVRSKSYRSPMVPDGENLAGSQYTLLSAPPDDPS